MDSLYPPERLRGLVRNTLGEGETSRVHRVRAPAEVNSWFASMTAQERGHVLGQVMAWLDRSRPAVLAAFDGPADAGAGQTARRTLGRPSRPSQGLEGVTALVVVDPHIPQRTKNDLRWSPERYAALEELLAGAGRLDLHRTNGKYTWRTPDGQTVRKDTVQMLVQAGVLVRPEQSSS